MRNDIVIYGFAGADQGYAPVRYEFLAPDGLFVIHELTAVANLMVANMPNIKEVYAVDRCHGLQEAYRNATKRNTTESLAAFRDYIKKGGLRII